MELEVNKRLKLTQAIFLENSGLAQIWAKRSHNGSEMDFEIESFVFARNVLKSIPNNGTASCGTIHL